MEISIIIPSYRPGSYIYESLESIRKQTFPLREVEVLVVLNGCDEPYLSELEEYAEKVKGQMNVKLYQLDQGGVSNARNVALQLTHGKFIAFIDDDDYISPTYLQELYDIAIQGYVPVSNVVAFNEDTNETCPSFLTDAFQRCVGKGPLPLMNMRSFMSTVWCKLIDKKLLYNRFFDTRLSNGEDCLFMLQISHLIKVMAPTSENAIYYRRLRADSAVTRRMGVGERFQKALKMSMFYVWIYLKNPFRYNIFFFTSRIVGAFRGVFVQYY